MRRVFMSIIVRKLECALGTTPAHWGLKYAVLPRCDCCGVRCSVFAPFLSPIEGAHFVLHRWPALWDPLLWVRIATEIISSELHGEMCSRERRPSMALYIRSS